MFIYVYSVYILHDVSMVNMLKLFTEVLQLQMRKRMMHLSCRSLSLMEGKQRLQKFSKVMRQETKIGTRLCVSFSSVSCHNFVITSFSYSSQDLQAECQDHEIPICMNDYHFNIFFFLPRFNCESHENLSKLQYAIGFIGFGTGPRSHLKLLSRHSNKKMRRSCAECMAVVVESVTLCDAFEQSCFHV